MSKLTSFLSTPGEVICHGMSEQESLLKRERLLLEPSRITTRSISKRIAPRLNAPGSASQPCCPGTVNTSNRQQPDPCLYLCRGFLKKGFVRCGIKFPLSPGEEIFLGG